jgi:alpha-glucosidase (family GH31 glycosyl hydrolase)
LLKLRKFKDTQVADIDHMDERKMFTIDPVRWNGLNGYFKELIDQGMKTIILFDPFLIVNDTNYGPFTRGKDKGVFITWPKDVKNPDYEYTNSSIMVGYVRSL